MLKDEIQSLLKEREVFDIDLFIKNEFDKSINKIFDDMKEYIIDTIKTKKNVKISDEIIKGTYDKLSYMPFFRTIYLSDSYEYKSHLGKVEMGKDYYNNLCPVFNWNSFVSITEEKKTFRRYTLLTLNLSEFGKDIIRELQNLFQREGVSITPVIAVVETNAYAIDIKKYFKDGDTYRMYNCKPRIYLAIQYSVQV